MTFTRRESKVPEQKLPRGRTGTGGSENVSKINRWKRIAFAALLIALTAFAYHAASVGACTHLKRARDRHVNETVLRGEGFVRLAGYELNVSFTPEGRFVGLDITAART